MQTPDIARAVRDLLPMAPNFSARRAADALRDIARGRGNPRDALRAMEKVSTYTRALPLRSVERRAMEAVADAVLAVVSEDSAALARFSLTHGELATLAAAA